MNFVSILLCAGLASGLASASITALTPSDQALIVNLHNNFRFRQPAKDMTPIRWDAALARQAQSWTDRCRYGHQYSRAFGENIGAGGGPGYDTNSGIINHVFNLWVDEAKYNTDGKFTCCGVGGFKCCHFLQVIWAYSTKIGCGLTPCPWGNYLACYYQPKGNIMMNGKMTPYTPR